MAKKPKEVQELKVQRPNRAKLTEEETLKRMEAFGERREQFIAAARGDGSSSARSSHASLEHERPMG